MDQVQFVDLERLVGAYNIVMPRSKTHAQAVADARKWLADPSSTTDPGHGHVAHCLALHDPVGNPRRLLEYLDEFEPSSALHSTETRLISALNAAYVVGKLASTEQVQSIVSRMLGLCPDSKLVDISTAVESLDDEALIRAYDTFEGRLTLETNRWIIDVLEEATGIESLSQDESDSDGDESDDFLEDSSDSGTPMSSDDDESDSSCVSTKTHGHGTRSKRRKTTTTE